MERRECGAIAQETLTMDDVIRFPARTKPLSAAEALDRIGDMGVVEAASVADLGRSWDWKRERTSKALMRWQAAGEIEREDRPDGSIVIRVPGAVPAGIPAGNPAGTVLAGVQFQSVPAVAAAAPSVPAPMQQPEWRTVVPPVERPAKRDVTTLVIALALACVSAGFSIIGLTSVFVGAFWAVIAMGMVLEAGKLRAVALIGMGRGSRALRAALLALVAVLMGLNAIGCYGFLARAHIGHQVEGDIAVAARLSDIDGRIAVQTTTLADIDRRLGQIDGAIEKSMGQGKVNGAIALANAERGSRSQLQVDRMAAGRILTELKVEKAAVEGQRRIVEADLGPVRYLASLIGASDQDVLRYFILVVALLLDPAAVLLLLAATRSTAPRT
jgi:hypothetical protein